MFTYCGNNPINNSDQTGQWFIKDAIKWVTDKIAKPTIKCIEYITNKISVTHSKQVQISGSLIFSFNVNFGFSHDAQGNIAFQVSGSAGISSSNPYLAVAQYDMVTNAPTINDLNGPSTQIGGGFSAPIPDTPISGTAGGEICLLPTESQDTIKYGGLATYAGISTYSVGSELHIERGRTWTPFRALNIFDLIEGALNAISNW